MTARRWIARPLTLATPVLYATGVGGQGARGEPRPLSELTLGLKIFCVGAVLTHRRPEHLFAASVLDFALLSVLGVVRATVEPAGAWLWLRRPTEASA